MDVEVVEEFGKYYVKNLEKLLEFTKEVETRSQILDYQEKVINLQREIDGLKARIQKQASRITELEGLYSGKLSKDNERKAEHLIRSAEMLKDFSADAYLKPYLDHLDIAIQKFKRGE